MLVGANAKVKVLERVTNANRVCFPLIEDEDEFRIVDTIPEEIPQAKMTIVEVIPDEGITDIEISEDETEEEIFNEEESVGDETEEASEDVFFDDEVPVEDGTEYPVVKRDYRVLPAEYTTTILFDTERDAAGNAVQRHIYFYDGQENNLTEGNCSVVGESKIKRMSFPAGAEGLEQWRQALLKLAASKNQEVVASYFTLREKWENGEIDDVAFKEGLSDKLFESKCVLALKPMGETEIGDVIDAISVMCSCYISRFNLLEVSHTDSVMVFNALFPGKEMPAGVNYYSYGEVPKATLNADDLVLTSIAKKLEFEYSEEFLAPVLTVEIKESNSNSDGALVAMTIDDALVEEILASSTEESRENEAIPENASENVNINILETETYRELVRMYGNEVAEPVWMEVAPFANDSQPNRFMRTITDVIKLFSSNRPLQKHFTRGDILLYADRHLPYRSTKCVIDNLRQNNLNKMILAY